MKFNESNTVEAFVIKELSGETISTSPLAQDPAYLMVNPGNTYPHRI